VLSLHVVGDQVMDLLEHNTRKHMAVTIVRSVLKSGTLVREVDQVWPPFVACSAVVPARLSCMNALQVDMLFKFISLLIKDDEAHPQEAVRCSDIIDASRLLRDSPDRSCAAAGGGRGRL
jgi:hypothetical protein